MEQKEFSPMKATFPNPETIVCKDCVFRDRTTVEINDKTISAGVTKSFCEVYEQPPKTNGKPTEILFQNAKCEFYMKDEE